MNRWILVVAILAATSPLLTCHKDKAANEEPAAASVTYYKDIQPIMKERCSGCHDNGQIAFSLSEYQDTVSKKEAVIAAVLSRRMPVWPAAAGHQLYKEDPSLSEAQLALFKQWKENGFPAGQESDKPKDEHGTLLTDLQSDVTLPILGEGESYLPTQDKPDDYRCFIVSWPNRTSVQYITGFQGIPGDRRIAHHLVAYKVKPKYLPLIQELDAEEPGAGYGCFNGALPDRLYTDDVYERMSGKYPGVLDDVNTASQWIGHWAPGMRGHLLPAGTGIPVSPYAIFVIQVHYYSAGSPQTADKGGSIRLTLASQVEKPGFVVPFSQGDWLDGKRAGTLVIPAGQELTVHHSEPLTNLIEEGRSELGITGPIEAVEMHSANLHMHSYGKSAVAYLTNATGERETLLEIPRWNLNWQQDFTFAKPKVFTTAMAESNRMHVSCTFSNQTDRDIYGGFGSDDEMCFNFTYLTFVLKK